MRNSLGIPVSTAVAFLMVLARVSGTFIFIPIPGVKSGFESVRAVVVLSLTMALYPLWPALPGDAPAAGDLALALLSEAALGLTAGVALSVTTEAFLLAGQVSGLQAGYAYASVIDPATQADSGVLIVLAQLVASLLFFAAGLDRQVLAVMAHSLQTVPPGHFAITPPMAATLIRFTADMFLTGLKLALPVLAFLLMVDLALALAGRLQAQLQLVSLAFPAKMLAALLILAAVAPGFPGVFRQSAATALRILRGLTNP